jgi:ATP-dependent Clp protease adaptor protein ClpS
VVVYGAMPKGKPREQGDTAVVTEKKSKTAKPKLWKVILHNDDFTTMEFVIHALEVVFNKNPAEAYELMMQVHTRGFCVAGVYTYEIAETKVATVEQMARAAEFPFLCTMEPE